MEIPPVLQQFAEEHAAAISDAIAHNQEGSASMLHISSLLNPAPGAQPAGDASNIAPNGNDTNGSLPDDNDSAFGGSLLGTEADSLEESITDYPYENGRRYHAFKDGEYWVISTWTL